MKNPLPILICFAVEEEARQFRKSVGTRSEPQVTVTGMGLRNTEEALRASLSLFRPELVVNSGFAGGLNPALLTGTVVFDAEGAEELSSALTAAGARPGKFHCAQNMLVTSSEKAALWRSTGADAVEMESKAVQAICAAQSIPSAIVRVISDSAHEDLPLDFNLAMSRNQSLNYFKLARLLLASPEKIKDLLRFRRQVQFAARHLSTVLTQVFVS